ncbi:TPA: hypothetical protein DIV55_03725 [Patescibacteria group bacterium]|uniref:ATPase, F1 complex, delta/epsilon subunit n=1 Tax=Candidatus Gottesmanbacteria bacterium GW2011_GWA1_43_11 TaxID=1618436 RepID=A0A0G1FGQ3_9BACT|nr:MAG: ATPase, F1 complex, delta/epsilon subunit [Candidatus Gottesmanbacteria bacterium GW2011_GWA1_43_11]HCS78830.1 hypothetical protein [Patescibacteria group bacterium]
MELQLTIRSREGVLFTDTVQSLTAKNSSGTFDILPEHENFITLVDESVAVTTSAGQRITIPISNALLKVSRNQVSIYLGIRK